MSVAKRFTAAAGALALGGALVAGATGAQAEPIRWKMPIAFPSDLPGLGSPSKYVEKQLRTISGGEVQVRVYEPGKLVPPFDILEAVDAGKVSAGYTWIGYDQGAVPAVPLFAAVPFGLKPWSFAAWYYYGPGHEMLQEVYHNKGYSVHAQLCGIIGPETAGWYSKPINSLKDYKGLKIRFAGLGGKVLQKLGASVTMMPGGQLYQALQQGTIDATEFSMPAIDQNLGFDEVVKYNLFPGWHQQFTAQYMLVNQKAWDAASESQKALIETTCTAATMRGLAEGEFKNPKVLANFREKGVTAGQIPRETLRKLQDTAMEVLKAEAKKDKDFKRVWHSQRQFKELYQEWADRAYLPPTLGEKQ